MPATNAINEDLDKVYAEIRELGLEGDAFGRIEQR